MTKKNRKQSVTSESSGPEKAIRDSDRRDDWFNSLSPLQQATQILMEKICALNKGVTEALMGVDSTESLRIVAEVLKVNVETFLSALEAEETQNKNYLRL